MPYDPQKIGFFIPAVAFINTGRIPALPVCVYFEICSALNIISPSVLDKPVDVFSRFVLKLRD